MTCNPRGLLLTLSMEQTKVKKPQEGFADVTEKKSSIVRIPVRLNDCMRDIRASSLTMGSLCLYAEYVCMKEIMFYFINAYIISQVMHKRCAK